MTTTSITSRVWKPRLAVLLLLVAMCALGVWSNQPPPRWTPDEPQPLLQIFRANRHKELLLALPLRQGDQLRLQAELPTGLAAAAYWQRPDGTWTDLRPLTVRRQGELDIVSFPAVQAFPLTTPPGTHLFLVVANKEEPPTAAAVAELVGPAWPRLDRYTMGSLSRARTGMTGPRGTKLPPAEKTAAVEDRLAELGSRLARAWTFFAGVLVPQE